MQLLKLKLGLLLFLIANVNAFSQNTGISDVNRNPDASAVLDVFSTSKGMLAPRMTEAQRTAIVSPATGLLVYQTNGITPGFYYYTGSTWTPIAAGAGSQWTPEPSTNNIYYNAGSVGVGVSSPAEKLDIGGNLKLSGAFMPSNQPGVDGTVLQSKGAGVAPVWVDLTSSTNTYNWSLGGNNLASLGIKNFGTTSNTDLPVITNGFERMRIMAAGNIGIGTAAPFSPVHISVASGGNLLYLHGRAGGPGSSAGIIFKTYGDVNGVAGNPSAQINAIDDGSFSNHLTFSTKNPGADANALVERVRIASNGNVGIGVTNPAQKLDVNGNFNLSGAFIPGGVVGSQFQVLQAQGGNLPPVWVTPANSSYWALGGNTLGGLQNFGTRSAHDLPIITNNNERMRILAGGNVGIGTATPSERLEVNGNVRIIGAAGGTRRLAFLGTVATNSTGSGDPDGIIEVRPSGTANEQQEMLFYMGNDNSVVSGGASYGPDRIRMVAEEFRFQSFNDPSASTIGNAESQTGVNNRMVITAGGNVGIATETPTARLDVNGDFKLGTIGSVLNVVRKANFTNVDNNTFTNTTTKEITVNTGGITGLDITNANIIINPRSALPNGILIAYTRVVNATSFIVAFNNLSTTAQAIGSIVFDVTIIK